MQLYMCTCYNTDEMNLEYVQSGSRVTIDLQSLVTNNTEHLFWYSVAICIIFG